METEQIIDLMQKLSSSSVTKLKYKDENCFLELEKNNGAVNLGNFVAEKIEKNDSVPQSSATTDTEKKDDDCKVIESSLVGTFYASSTEGGAPLVNVGDKVKKGQVIGIIEAMKLMNEIESPYDGTVQEILVKNGEVIGYSQPLIKVK